VVASAIGSGDKMIYLEWIRRGAWFSALPAENSSARTRVWVVFLRCPLTLCLYGSGFVWAGQRRSAMSGERGCEGGRLLSVVGARRDGRAEHVYRAPWRESAFLARGGGLPLRARFSQATLIGERIGERVPRVRDRDFGDVSISSFRVGHTVIDQSGRLRPSRAIRHTARPAPRRSCRGWPG
jgi:hypothetical protein